MHTYKRNFTLLIIFLIFLFGNESCQLSRKQREVKIIPKPQKISLDAGYFKLKDTLIIQTISNNLQQVTGLLKGYLKEEDILATISGEFSDKSNSSYISLDVIADSAMNAEGYTLSVQPDHIAITAVSQQGLFYGIQSLRQLIITNKDNRIHCMTINDWPRFSWRGMHLDVSRHFMPVSFIKKYIDYLAFLKMNTFHWHLVDDQGWRIEIKRYPKLTEIGAWRDSTLVGYYKDRPRRYDGKRYGGFYTQNEIKDIVAYAQKRFITIVPEIELPGHSQAAIASYPKLGCTHDKVAVWTRWGVSPYIYNVDESTFTFLENVLNEVIQLFPSKYIHIGGDEALKTQWKKSKEVQRRMKKLGITDEEKLQGYFVARIQKYLESKGREIIGWDEIMEGGIGKNAAVMSWRGTQEGIDAARAGHKVVMTPIKYCYFDHYQSKDPGEPLAIGGYLPMDSIYWYNPVPKELSDSVASRIMGVQGNVWTEYLPTPKQVEYMLFPRIFAMSEIQWSSPEHKDYSAFEKRVRSFEPYLKKMKVNYSPHGFTKK